MTLPGAPGDPLVELQLLRLRQLVLVLALAMLAIGLTQAFRMPLTILAVIGAGIGLLGLALWLQERGRLDLAMLVVLSSCTAVATAIIVLGAGLRDAMLLAYPGILMLAAMTVSSRPLIGLGVLMLLVLGVLTWTELAGLYRPEPVPLSPWSFVNRVVILFVTALVARSVALDLQAAVRRAEAESQRAKDSALRLAFLVQHDALTGLPNRLLVQDRFLQAQARARRDRAALAVLVIDLDDFRRVNDSLGHGVGDAVLQRMAERLRTMAADTDTVGRLGADEFVIVSAEAADADGLAAYAQRVLDGLAEPFERDGLRIACGSSIGIACYPHDGDSFEILLNRAEAALARAKADGRGAYRFADPAVDKDVGEHLRIVAELRAGLDRGEFALHYQPIVGLADGEVRGVEALVRWHHPERGLVQPGAFIPLAERSGLIHLIGAWALAEAALQLRRWEARGLPLLAVSVNVSPLQLVQGDLEGAVRRALDGAAVPPSRLVLELTESSLVGDVEPLRARVARLRALGVGLAIDDFGTGYSNLGYLQRFDVQSLKIDRRFVRGLANGAQGEAIVGAIVQLATSLGIRSVAEGVESEAEMLRLRTLGCVAGQGHWWSDAMPADGFERWYQQRHPAPASC
ncbi:MAG TPA: hypothetical protein DCM32_06090 [Xanthomonadaceae bacterium]|nr:hypothetical protein [Xanthomonadaceae bacterium]